MRLAKRAGTSLWMTSDMRVHQAQTFGQEVRQAQPHLGLLSDQALKVFALHEGNRGRLHDSAVQALQPPTREHRPRGKQRQGESIALGRHPEYADTPLLYEEQSPVVLL